MLNARRAKRWVVGLFPESMYLPLFYYYRKLRGRLDPELVRLQSMLTGCRTALDIGANRGLYSFGLSRLCKSVIAFEPQPACARKISAYNSANITVNNVALSNRTGKLSLFVPYDSRGIELDGLASFSELPNARELTVPIAKLDDFNLTQVDFIKIDVEGHEVEVLDGAKETIRRDKPIMLIEIEQRHQARNIQDIISDILSLGYRGYFLLRGELVPIEQFSYERFQKPYLSNAYHEDYVNNFFFLPNDRDGSGKRVQ